MKTVFNLKRIYVTALLFMAGSVCGASLEDFLFTVQCNGRETGSGFLLKDTSGVWMVSNCHVVRKSGEIKFVGMLDKSRTYTLPETVDVAANRDAVRFLTKEENGFSLSGTSSFDETVFAFGNSDGLGVITKSEGKIVGKGRGEIEVTCEIIPGNSGGPVINTNDAVIGVAAFTVTVSGVKASVELSGTVSAAERERLAEKIKNRHGTRYTEARRFAVPLHDAEWQPVGLELFKQESEQYEKMDDQYDRFNETVTAVFRCRAVSSENEDIFSRSWVSRYNRDLNDYGYYDSDSGRYYLRSGQKTAFDHAYERWIQALGETASRLSEEFGEQAKNMTVLYYQNEISKSADRLGITSRELTEVSEKYRH
jgi:hypothetical protein